MSNNIFSSSSPLIHWPTKQVQKGWNGFKSGVHQTAVLAKPDDLELFTDISTLVCTSLSYLPGVVDSLEPINILTKEVKSLISLFKGVNNLDWFINGPKRTWTLLAKNVSGFALVIFNSLLLVERFGWSNLSALHRTFAAVPLVGVLRFAGLFNLAMLGLYGSLLSSAISNFRHLNKEKEEIAGRDKLNFWGTPLNADKIQARLASYEQKLQNLQATINENVETQTINGPNTELTEKIIKARAASYSYLLKKQQWTTLSQNFATLPEQVEAGLQVFQQAKLAKWKTKIHKIDYAKNTEIMAIFQRTISIASVVVTSALTVSGIGLVAVPFIGLGVDGVKLALTIGRLYRAKAVEDMQCESVPLALYPNLPPPLAIPVNAEA